MLNPYNSSNCTFNVTGGSNLAIIPLYCAGSSLVHANPVAAGSNSLNALFGASADVEAVTGSQGYFGTNGYYSGTNWVQGTLGNSGTSAVRTNSVTVATGSVLYNGGIEFSTSPNYGGVGGILYFIDTACNAMIVANGLDTIGKAVNRTWLNPQTANSIPGSATNLPSGYSANIGTDTTLQVNTPTTLDNHAAVFVAPAETADKGLVIQDLPSQSANLQEWQSSSGGVLGYVTPYGVLGASVFASIPLTVPFSSTPTIQLGTALWRRSR